MSENNEKKELTIELTNYCPHACKYCSSNTTWVFVGADFIEMKTVEDYLYDKYFDRIILSGGEPLAHPKFYAILLLAKQHARDVVVYTNALTHICYNANVIDGIYVAANLTVNDSTNQVKILKRVNQGRESTRPEISFSGNFDGKCPCNSPVILPNGSISKSPCQKDAKSYIESLKIITPVYAKGKCRKCGGDTHLVSENGLEPSLGERCQSCMNFEKNKNAHDSILKKLIPELPHVEIKNADKLDMSPDEFKKIQQRNARAIDELNQDHPDIRNKHTDT